MPRRVFSEVHASGACPRLPLVTANTTDALRPLLAPVPPIVWLPNASVEGSRTVIVKFPLASLESDVKLLPSTATFNCSFERKPVPLRFTRLPAAPELGLIVSAAPPTLAAPLKLNVVRRTNWLV